MTRWFMLCAIAFAARAEDLKDISHVGFMAGCWSTTDKGETTEEMWTKPAGGTMLGLSRTVKDGKTTFTEHMQMGETNGVLTMFVQLKLAEKATAFKLTITAANEAVFTTGLEWPRQLSYKLRPDGTLFARIEGKQGGREMAIDFPYKRAKCE
jgi:hypothetical protein